MPTGMSQAALLTWNPVAARNVSKRSLNGKSGLVFRLRGIRESHTGSPFCLPDFRDISRPYKEQAHGALRTLSLILVVSLSAIAVAQAQEILTPNPSVRPRINGAMIFGVRPGHPLLYTIAATGKRPMRFAVTGLPAGLTLDAKTGRLGGTTTVVGTHVVTLRASNDFGSAERKLPSSSATAWH